MCDAYNRSITYMRISITDRCNLRCTYCMPAEGIPLLSHTDILSFEEIVELVRVAVELGVTKVRLTGGEPLVRKGVVDLVQQLRSISAGIELCLTTNATLLAPLALPLRDAGLDRINISLDSGNVDNYARITRGGDLAEALRGIDSAIAVGFTGIKLNCVIEESSDEPDAVSVARIAAQRGFALRYIHRMETPRGKFSQVIGGDGGNCTICNRLRVSAHGRVYPCLFNNVSFSVRELGPRQALLNAVNHKPECGSHSNNNFSQLGG